MGSPNVTITPDEQPVSIVPDPPRSAWDSVKDFVGEVWKQNNPIAGIQGAKEAAAHPIETLKNDAAARQQVYQKAEEEFKNGRTSGAAAHLLYSFLPFLGPQLSESGSNMEQGNYAKGSGQAVGLGLSLATPKVASNVMQAVKPAASRALLLGKTPAEAYQSALKPSTTLSEADRGNIVATGLNEGIPVSSSGLNKVGDLVDDLNSKVKAVIASDPNRPVNKFKVASNLSKTADKFSTQVSPTADLKAISDVGNDFIETAPNPIPAAQAQAMKQGTYRAIGDKAFGELKGATIEAQKSLARGLKDEIANQFPELNSLNAREGKLLDLQPVLEKAVARIGNHQLVGIGTGVVAGAAKAITGSNKVAGAAAIMKAVLDDPVIKSRLAIALNRSGIPPAQVAAKISAYQASLGSAALGRLTSSTNDTQDQSPDAAQQ